MVITYHGGECFKVSFGSTTLVFNPISKKSKLPPTRFGADVVFITMNHPDMNGAEEMAYGAKQPLVVDGPGEYEIGEVTARGFGIKTKYEGVDRYNTVYQVMLENINMVFLGALGSEAIDPHILSEFGSIDILFVPIGGGDVIDVPAASKLATKLEARCIIPMHGTDAAIKAFLKEEGAESVKPVEKLTVKKKDLLEMESEIVIIKS
jgi:L-ascorbate metabolism protein UlaG (beta-lactamase superfamily)